MYGMNLLTHFRSLYQSANRVGASIKIDFSTLHVEITHEGKYFELVPRFAKLLGAEGWFELQPTMSRDTSLFSGWSFGNTFELPIRNNRNAFKKFCEAKGVLTPKLFSSPATAKAQVLIKDVAAMRRGNIQGPMSIADAFKQPLPSGRYVEEYVEGDPFQAWYFAGQVACVERREKIGIKGDGRSTVAQLLSVIKNPFADYLEPTTESLLRAHDVTLDSVLADKRVVPISFRFQSPQSAFQPYASTNENVLDKLQESEILEQLKQVGSAVLAEVPKEHKRMAIFRLDGVIDRQDRVWTTSIPHLIYVHPDIYSVMIPQMLGIKLSKEVKGVTFPPMTFPN